MEAAEPEIVPQWAKGASELRQASADAAPVVSAERLLPDRLPSVVGEYPSLWKAAMRLFHSRRGCPWVVVIKV